MSENLMQPNPSSEGGNGQVKMTMALIGQKLDTFIEEERQWRLLFSARMDKADDRMTVQSSRIGELDVKRGISEEEHKAIWAAISELKYSVRTWNIANSVAIIIAGLLAFFFGK